MATLGKRNNRLEVLVKSAVALLLAGLFVQAVMSRGEPGENLVSRVVMTVLGPVLNVGARLHHGAEGAWLAAFETERLRSENEALREELARARRGDAVGRSEEALAYLAQEVSTHIPDGSFELHAAPVLAGPSAGGRQVVWIRGGRDRGFRPAMIALGPQGIVGQIEQVHETMSLVELVTDRRSAWGVEVDGRAVPGLLRGTGDPQFVELHFTQTAVEVEPQDRVVSSGMAGSAAPGGVEFGIVQELRLSKSGEPIALVRLAERPAALRTLFILPHTRIPFDPAAKK